MIELRTGIPGSGKTLSMVQALDRLLKSWEKKPEEGRPIYVHNIKELALPHAVLPVKEVTAGSKKQVVPDWELVPDGALIIVDECQDLFPPRSSQSAAPEHISWFNTHRHRGIDIWITTQHPKLIDFSLRALVGKHMHYRRVFGGQRAIVYEWDGCSDNLGGMKDAVTSYFGFPKDAFKFYKSAEVHTKQKFRLPKWLLVPVAGVALGVFTIPGAYSSISNGISGKGISTKTHAATGTGGGGAIAPTATGPSVAASSSSSASSAVVSKPVEVEAVKVSVAGCIRLADQCDCLDGKGVKVERVAAICDQLGKGPAISIGVDTPNQAAMMEASAGDVAALAFMAQRRKPIL